MEYFNINEFLKTLRESADIQFKVFTQGSCYRLYMIIYSIDNSAEPYWSDVDNHCIIKLNNKFYDIGGEVSTNYIESKGYFLVPESQRVGYSLLKYAGKNTTGVVTEKYVK